MNLLNLITESQRLASRVDSDFNDRCRRWINEAQTQWAISVPWKTLARQETFAMDGTQNLILPERVLTVKWVLDRTNKHPIKPYDTMDQDYPWAIVQNTPGAIQAWEELGIQPVVRQPSASGTLQVQTTASDTFNVYLAGLVEDTNQSGTAEQFYTVKETVVVSSSGPNTTSNSFVRVEVFGKDKYSAGDVTLKDVSGNQLARLPAYSLQSEYRVLRFMLVPDAGTLVDIFYLQKPLPLVDNAQQPPPAVETDYLIWYAAGMMHAAQGQEEQSQVKLARAQEILTRRITKDRKHGDKDWRAIPDPQYWANEEQYETPNNFYFYGW